MLICIPSALPRSLSGKAEMTMAIEVPWVIAAPTPISTRNRISIHTLAAAPDSAAKVTKTTNPATYTLLRPTMSASLPMGSSNALMVRAYPMITHWVVGRSVPKSPAMVGRATPLLPWSATEVKSPMARAPKAHHL